MDYDNKVNSTNLQLTALEERFKDKINIQPLVIKVSNQKIIAICSEIHFYQESEFLVVRHLAT